MGCRLDLPKSPDLLFSLFLQKQVSYVVFDIWDLTVDVYKCYIVFLKFLEIRS